MDKNVTQNYKYTTIKPQVIKTPKTNDLYYN